MKKTLACLLAGLTTLAAQAEFTPKACIPVNEIRFTDIGDGTVIDNQTGLMWIKSPHDLTKNESKRSWEDAVGFCSSLSYAGHSDWRLPTRNELTHLTDYGHCEPALTPGHPFTGIQYNYYWSGTSFASYTNYAWTINMESGDMLSYDKTYRYYIWPVRCDP